MTEYPDLEKLKAANEALRQQGQEWIFATVENICDEINGQFAPVIPLDTPDTTPAPTVLQVGVQDWKFEVEKNVMVGERMGVRSKGQTLTIEIGWPREPEHGIVPDLGLARARVSFSPNVMIDALLINDLTLRRVKNSEECKWYVIADKKLGAEITAETLRGYVQRVLAE